MELPQVPQDDFLDVLEMKNKIENYVDALARDNEKNITVSALISASINCLISQCDNLSEVIFFRNLLIDSFDSAIRSLDIKKPDPPSS